MGDSRTRRHPTSSGNHVVQGEVVIPSDTAEGKRIQDDIVALLEARQFGSRDVFSVRLALEEALVNAIKHGNAHDRSKRVRVAYRVSEDRVWIEIEDEGCGFRIEDVPDPTAPENLERPCGRGILLMRSFMTSVEYNDRGNCVSMWKCRTRDTGEVSDE